MTNHLIFVSWLSLALAMPHSGYSQAYFVLNHAQFCFLSVLIYHSIVVYTFYSIALRCTLLWYSIVHYKWHGGLNFNSRGRFVRRFGSRLQGKRKGKCARECNSERQQTRPAQIEERNKETSLKVMPTPHIRPLMIFNFFCRAHVQVGEHCMWETVVKERGVYGEMERRILIFGERL